MQEDAEVNKTKKQKKRKKASTKETKSAKKKNPVIPVDKISHTILGERTRCEKLKSPQEEVFIVSMINVLLAQGMVRTLGQL